MLNQDQQKVYDAAMKWWYNQESQLFEIAGAAGTGKTFLINEILRGLRLRTNQILPMAYTGAAALVMRTRGFTTAKSIHSSLYELQDYYDLEDIDPRTGLPVKKYKFGLKPKFLIDASGVQLFLIDEAYMVPSNMVADIMSFGIRVIVCGDPNQLPPIEGDPAFLVNPGVYRLNQLMRQSADDPIVYLAMRALNGLPIHNGLYGNNVLVCNNDEFSPQMIGYADVVLCGTNKTRENINSYVRHLARFDNSIFPKPGERVICRQNNWNITEKDIALVNGLAGTVTACSGILDAKGKHFMMSYIPDRTNIMFNDLQVNYEYFRSNTEHRKYLKNISNNMPWITGEFFEYAYALSVHLSQGSEYDKGIILEEFLRPQIQKQLIYTAITRFKKSLIILKHNTKKQVYINPKDVLLQTNNNIL